MADFYLNQSIAIVDQRTSSLSRRRFDHRHYCYAFRMSWRGLLAESFFATLECELLARQRFPTRNAARLALFDYIEGFYNTHRRHSALGYLSPAAYERRWAIPTEVT